jgi:hypothetical protein
VLGLADYSGDNTVLHPFSADAGTVLIKARKVPEE